MGNRVTARLLALVLMTTTFFAVAGSDPAAAGSGIGVATLKSGLDGPAAFTFTPKGRIYYLERGTGEVRVLNPSTGSDRRFFRIPGVNGDGERGALGIALHPRWPSAPFVYVYATRRTGGRVRNQIVRIRMRDNHGAGFKVLLSTPASASPYHNGGRILFGPDGKLYAIVGDGHDSANAQDRTKNLRGKILRMTATGAVPSDNPVPGSRIWAYGIRNSFGLTFDPRTGRLWETENGPSCNDEINLILPGGNFGWGPRENCGSGTSPGNTNNSGPKPRFGPKSWFVSTIGITGSAFCNGCGLPAGYDGELFFGSVVGGQLRVVGLNAGRDDVAGSPAIVLDSLGNAIYSMEAAPNGTIYFSDSGAIYRLTPA